MDDEFLHAFIYGLVSKLRDGIERLSFPRFMIYSMDYQEKWAWTSLGSPFTNIFTQSFNGLYQVSLILPLPVLPPPKIENTTPWIQVWYECKTSTNSGR